MNNNSQNQGPLGNENSEFSDKKDLKSVKKKFFSRKVSLLLVVGGGMAVIGLLMGAKTSTHINNTKINVGTALEEGIGMYTSNDGANVSKSRGNIVSLQDLDLESFTIIKSNSTFMDVRILESDTYGIDIKYDERLGNYNYTVENDTLVIENEKRLNFNVNTSNLKDNYIKIYVPANADFKDVTIGNVSGNVSLEKLIADNLNVNTTSCDIELRDIHSSEATISSVSGSIDTKNLTSNQLICKNTSGGITLENIQSDSLAVNTISGKIEISNSDILQNINAKSTSGRINIEKSKSERLSAKTVSGSINLEGEFLGITELNSTSGGITANMKSLKESDCNYDISTASGSINVDGNKYKKTVTQNKDAANTINMHTLSGNIYLQFK